MPFLDTIKAQIGNDTYLHLEKQADTEVGLAKKMPLRDSSYQEMFYTQRDRLGTLPSDFELFERRGLKVTPAEVVGLLFRCKLLFAVSTEQEYRQRMGAAPPFRSDVMAIYWSSRSDTVDALIEKSFDRLERDIKHRTLITRLNSFRTDSPGSTSALQTFFDTVFSALGEPLQAFVDKEALVEKHRQAEPWLCSHDPATAADFYQIPAIGSQVKGSYDYCFWKSVFSLRTFLHLLRIGAFISPGQMDSGLEVKVIAPTHPVFLGTHATGCFMWNEDKKESWAKIPDGSLFLSFGFRGLAKMWLDRRTFAPLTKFLVAKKGIFHALNNPWTDKSLSDIAPALDILSSAVQIPDLGAKILLVYTCLEHFFVPAGTKSNQRAFIVGGLKALNPTLIPWFEKLYKLRCDYAHRGFVIRDEETIGLIQVSVMNAVDLLVAKLSLI